MQKLFIEPTNRITRSPIGRLGYLTHYNRSNVRLVVIDGLDECSDPKIQREILRVISSAVQRLRFPPGFWLPVHFSNTFNELDIKMLINKIDLSEHGWQTDSDIRTFLIKQFNKIKETHPLQPYLPLTWKTDENVNELVRRSSGQFIYASFPTVPTGMRYISSPWSSSEKRLVLSQNSGLRVQTPEYAGQVLEERAKPTTAPYIRSLKKHSLEWKRDWF
jgi:hypothetical protein